MKRFFATCTLLAALLVPATADTVVDELLVRRSGDDVNIRVSVRNPVKARQPGPIVIDLYVRATEADTWTKIKSWGNLRALAGGHRVSRDFFDENSAMLRSLADGGRFQARAVVTAPGQAEAVERTSWYDTTGGDY